MIEIVFLQGGLGNQMFQYAFYLSKRHSNMKIRCDYSLLQGQNRSHNGFELDDVFGIWIKNGSVICFLFFVC